ncbi:MAG: dehydrogenase maturation factor [Methanothermococcus sp.]|jgi:CO dehydrogenase maturation factor|uniref:ATP-binding protein n=1 Tax=Methanothermococcus TaxID=155862 RepID=UPI00036CE8EB|nr:MULTISPECIES: AAA family ATPase [Methanothermococcus]MDK2790826.1 dehydrogenase maturation factor [Methanothermococcus sp.]MDK2978958.1 dehydrogenase maturation factor [Bacteroidales bacterium]MDK2988299.1 dehydrogenase maturation factor [Methanothermococcus sp.]
MKIAITGKGGVGKTFLSATLARLFEKNNYKVIAVDADPDMNLGCALGIDEEITPLSKMDDLIEERTGARVGEYGSVFKINPKVDDILDKYSYTKGNISLLVMGTVEKGGGGCVCPATVLLRRLLKHLVTKRDEVVILDMEAGIEHLGRKVTENVDLMIVVVEPSKKSILTAERIKKLANDIGVTNLKVVVNKVKNKEEKEIFKEIFEKEVGIPILGFVSYNDEVSKCDLVGKPIDLSSKPGREIEDIFKHIIETKNK